MKAHKNKAPKGKSGPTLNKENTQPENPIQQAPSESLPAAPKQTKQTQSDTSVKAAVKTTDATPVANTVTTESATAVDATAECAEVVKTEPTWLTPNQQWNSIYEAVVGLAHRDANPPLPCQDSAQATCKTRPIVMIADGAGSSAVSEIGSAAVTQGLMRMLSTLEQQVSALLDHPGSTIKNARDFGLLLVKHAYGILQDLSSQHRRPLKDFRCTLLLAIQGKSNVLWIKIGDGALVGEHMQKQGEDLAPRLFTFGVAGKGEFANLTTFIDDHLQPEDVQIGLHPSALVTGLAAMSDGAADRLVANDGSQVANQVAGWLHQLRAGKLKRRTLTKAFYADSFTTGTTGDDCCIALAACGFD